MIESLDTDFLMADNHSRSHCSATSCKTAWDTTSCIPIQRKSSRSLNSILSADESSIGLPSLGASDTSLSTSTLDGSFLSSSLSSSSRRQRRKGKQLRWGKLEMRFYAVIPGDHPDTARGPPVRRSDHSFIHFHLTNPQITIGWDHFSSISVDIDTYEASKTHPSRQRDALRLSWMTRRRILMRVGASEDDIYSAVESSHQVQKQRKQTLTSLHRRQVALEVVFSAIRWTRSVFKNEQQEV